ncbi:MAG: hypothetical protein ACKVT1_09920 [Dehalococcoidia bacterium]
MDEVVTRSRCAACGRRMPFDDWKRGASDCASCRRPEAAAPFPAMTAPPRPQPARAAQPADYRQHQRLLDDIPEGLIDELVEALERETASRSGAAPGKSPSPPMVPAIKEFVQELGIGTDPRELTWAAWGFAAGFGGNLILAKYVQMTNGASFSSFVVPLLLGGIVSGTACAGIAWGFTRLRARG